MSDTTFDPTRDWELQQTLQSIDPVPADVDWVRLQRAIEERAALPLARRRRDRDRRRWFRPILPAVAAASLAALVGVQIAGFNGVTEPGAEASGMAALRPVFEEVLGGPISEAELDLLLGEVSADRLVLATLTWP